MKHTPRALTLGAILCTLALTGALGLTPAPAQASWEFGAKTVAGSEDMRYYGEGTLRDSSSVGSGRVKQLGATPPV